MSRVSRVLRAAGLGLAAGGVAIGLARCASDPPPAAPSPAAEAGSGGTGGGWQWDAGVYDAPAADAPPPIDAPVDTATLDADTTGYEWLFDDAWTPVETLPGCDSAVTDVKKLAWPGFVWQSCGEGCQRSEAVIGPKLVFKGAASTGSGSKMVNGELVLYIAAGVRLPPAAQWVAAVRASDDSVLSILRTYGDDCTPSFSRNHGRVAVVLGNGVGKAALVHATPSGIISASPLLPLTSPRQYFDFDDGWGAIAGQALLSISEQFDSATFTHVYSAPGTANIPKGFGKAVYWRDWTDLARLHVWTKAGGPRKLVEGPYHALAFAVAPGKLAWLGVTGDPLFSVFTSATLYSSPLALDPDALILGPGIPLPIIKFGEPMYMAGKWVVLPDDGVRQLLVNLDTKEVWAIDAPAGHFQTPLGISDTTLFVTDSPPGSSQPYQNFYNLLRYDLAKLPAYGKKL